MLLIVTFEYVVFLLEGIKGCVCRCFVCCFLRDLHVESKTVLFGDCFCFCFLWFVIVLVVSLFFCSVGFDGSYACWRRNGPALGSQRGTGFHEILAFTGFSELA